MGEGKVIRSLSAFSALALLCASARALMQTDPQNSPYFEESEDRSVPSVRTSTPSTMPETLRDTPNTATSDDYLIAKRSDTSIKREVQTSLLKDQTLSPQARKVRVRVKRGKVTLKGSVASEQERTILIERASRVVGSESVRNELTVDGYKK